MANDTVLQIVNDALTILNITGDNTPINAAQTTRGLRALNDLISSWSLEGLTIPFTTRESFTLSVNQSSRTIGTNANFNTTRPQSLEYVFVRDSNNTDYPLESIPYNVYEAISSKSTLGRPERYYYNPSYANGIIYFYPTPDTTYTVYIDSLKPFSEYTLSTDTVTLPDEYKLVLIHNLAVLLAAPNATIADQTVIDIAMSTKDKLKARNMKIPTTEFDFPNFRG